MDGKVKRGVINGFRIQALVAARLMKKLNYSRRRYQYIFSNNMETPPIQDGIFDIEISPVIIRSELPTHAELSLFNNYFCIILCVSTSGQEETIHAYLL